MARTTQRRLEMVLGQLRERTLAGGDAPAEVADYAVAATRNAMGGVSGRGMARRVEAYYEAVVRRRVVRDCSGTAHAARLVATSVVADLLESGRSAQDAWDELSRGWAHLLTPELSREFRERLCA